MIALGAMGPVGFPLTLLSDQPPSQQGNAIAFDPIADALAAIRNGESIVVVDDENR